MNNYIAIKETTRGFSKEFIDQGFCLTFANEVYVSVRFGTGNYCDQGETTAEVAVIDKDDNWYTYYDGKLSMYPEGSEVNARVNTDDLAEILMLAKKL
jgi:hypothetical protein